MKRKTGVIPDITKHTATSFSTIATHPDVQFLLSKDHIWTDPPCYYMGRVKEIMENAVFCRLILGVKEKTEPCIIKKQFHDLLLSAGAYQDYEAWNIFRQPIKKADHNDQPLDIEIL